LRSDHSLRPGDVPDDQRCVAVAGRILTDEFDFAAVVVDARKELLRLLCIGRAVERERRKHNCRTQHREALHLLHVLPPRVS
jgi:hypothetical protein